MSLKLDAPQATNSKDFSAVIEDLDAKAKAVSVGLGTVVAEAKADDEVVG
jgi:2-keto-3-deoxy-6-phosphogluconate aldolase